MAQDVKTASDFKPNTTGNQQGLFTFYLKIYRMNKIAISNLYKNISNQE